MAKLSKTTRTVIIAAGVLLVLGAVLLVLMLTSPADDDNSSGASTGESTGTSEAADSSVSDSSGTSSDSEKIVITDKEQENVLKMEVRNETGSFSFERNQHEVSVTDDDGNVSTSTEYYWTSPELDGVDHNDSTIGSFVRCMAGLSASSMVEENAQDLEKYGLADPVAEVKVTFDDGTSADICFGIRNPAASNYVYCLTNGGSDVMQVSYYSAGSAFYDIRDFVNLVLTEAYDANNAKELDYLVIDRKDLDEEVRIEYMADVAAESEKEDSVITTFNTHRITSPITAELDTTKGQTFCYGLYSLTASSCEYIDPTEQETADAGLDDPFCKVSFKYGGKARVLLLGNEIRTASSDDESSESLSSVTGYYAMFEGGNIIYSISTDNAPWYTFQVQDIMSRRPISPYIYTIDTLTVTTPDGEYVFKVSGDADDHVFTCGDTVLNDSSFKSFYQHLITSMGEELYFSDEKPEPYITLNFKYREEYYDTYGRSEDTIEFYKSDDRKNIVSVNGDILYKVRQIYTQRLLENLDALFNGGEIKLDW